MLLLLFSPVSAQELPAATALEVRLSGATGSRISHRGDPIEATIIAPVSVHGRILVPQGSRLLGSIVNVTAIGFGLKHSTASIAYAFHTLQLSGGAAIPVDTRLVEVETAKEHVDDLGTVGGIHPIMSLSLEFVLLHCSFAACRSYDWRSHMGPMLLASLLGWTPQAFRAPAVRQRA